MSLWTGAGYFDPNTTICPLCRGKGEVPKPDTKTDIKATDDGTTKKELLSEIKDLEYELWKNNERLNQLLEGMRRDREVFQAKVELLLGAD